MEFIVKIFFIVAIGNLTLMQLFGLVYIIYSTIKDIKEDKKEKRRWY